MSVMEIRGKIAVVTGGAKGIGAALVERLLREEIKKVTILDVLEAEGKELQKILNKKYGENKVHFIKCDMSNQTDINAFLNQVFDQHKHIDILINNAGIMDETKTGFKKMIDINYTGVVSSTLKAMELMSVSRDVTGSLGGGTIVNIASLAAVASIPVCPIYSGTKSAVMAFSNTIGAESHYSRTNVRVITLCFGRTDTTILDGIHERCIDKNFGDAMLQIMDIVTPQSAESAADGTLQAMKHGNSGSTWVVNNGKTVDITSDLQECQERFNNILYLNQ